MGEGKRVIVTNVYIFTHLVWTVNLTSEREGSAQTKASILESVKGSFSVGKVCYPIL